MCSSICVTRSTSSMVVTPAFTLFQPSVRNVRMPFSIARCAIVEAAERFKMRGRMLSFKINNS